MAGFKVVGSLGGGTPRMADFTMADAESIAVGQIVTLSSNEIIAGTTNDTTFLGLAMETVDNSDDGEVLRCIYSPDAIYAYRDGTAHAAGATLDLNAAGTGLTTNTNADFTVIENNAATEDTLVIITPGEHAYHAGG